VAAWPLAIACNIVRVTILVVASNYYGLGLLDTPFHGASGILTFWIVLALLILISDREALGEAST
jgi:exosortase/archaeosortase family protein